MNVHGLPAFYINKDISGDIIFTLQRNFCLQRIMIQLNEWGFSPRFGIPGHLKAKKTIDKQDLLVVNLDGIEVTYQRGPELAYIGLLLLHSQVARGGIPDSHYANRAGLFQDAEIQPPLNRYYTGEELPFLYGEPYVLMQGLSKRTIDPG